MTLWLYGFTLFLSAFLLFQVQMLLGKFILPWHGGVPAVWTTCMLFFQAALLAGYAWAHGLAGKAGPGAQRTLHLALIALSLTLLVVMAVAWQWPLLPDAGWRPRGDESPVTHILWLLTAAIGLPFVTLAATAPLLQHWFSRTYPNRSPYRLYALSNAGSLAGLLSYPFVVEVFMPLKWQAVLWSGGYGVFVLAMGVITVSASRSAERHGGATITTPEDTRERPSVGQRLMWFGLAACASVLLLAITNQLSQEIAVVPFLWVLPLALYLLSFILCFDNERWYVRNAMLALLGPALMLVTLAMQRGAEAPLVPQVLLYAAALFVICMVCHGELVRLKPPARHLTAFYLTLSAGGAAGGVFVGVLAPLLFQGYWELSIGLLASAALVAMLLWRDAGSVLHRSPSAGWLLLLASVVLALFVFVEQLRLLPAALLVIGGAGFAAGLLVVLLHVRYFPGAGRRWALVAALLVFAGVHAVFVLEPVHSAIGVTRNFFGVLQTTAHRGHDDEVLLRLTHGRTVHGVQYVARARRLEPTTYYTPQSGVGLALRQHPHRLAGQPLTVGVVGLGVGVLAAYGRDGDRFRFYEVNPEVIRLASAPEALFSFIRHSAATIDIVPGDARLSLEREPPQHYQLLVLDAFNSGSIPLHLLTREAFELYLRHLDPRAGVLALHVSNRYLDLTPVIAALAVHLDLQIVRIDHRNPGSGEESSWLLVAHRAELLPADGLHPVAISRVVWSDDYTNLLAALDWARPAGPDSVGNLKQLDDDARLLDILR